MKYLSAFSKGPAYAEVLINKMKKVEKASQAMDERVNQREHRRLKDIWDLAVHSIVYLLSSLLYAANPRLQRRTKWEI